MGHWGKEAATGVLQCGSQSLDPQVDGIARSQTNVDRVNSVAAQTRADHGGTFVCETRGCDQGESKPLASIRSCAEIGAAPNMRPTATRDWLADVLWKPLPCSIIRDQRCGIHFGIA
jgi:hypothetical protein